jgi:hypothetical protein
VSVSSVPICGVCVYLCKVLGYSTNAPTTSSSRPPTCRDNKKIKKRIVEVQRTKPNQTQTKPKPEAKRRSYTLQGRKKAYIHVCVVDDGRRSTVETPHTQPTQLLFSITRETTHTHTHTHTHTNIQTHRITIRATILSLEPHQPPPTTLVSRGCRTRDETKTRGKERERAREGGREGAGKAMRIHIIDRISPPAFTVRGERGDRATCCARCSFGLKVPGAYE